MTVTIIPLGVSKTLTYFVNVVKTNPAYSKEDVDWLLEAFVSIYDELKDETFRLTLLLTLLNQNCFSGYFARVFNSNIQKYTEKRNHIEVVNNFINPAFVEFSKSETLTEEERSQVNELLILDVTATNLTLKRMSLNPNLENNFQKAFDDSYSEVYNRLYINSVNSSRSNFQDFVILTEMNQKTKTNHAYTYKLAELLEKIIREEPMKEIEKSMLDNVTRKYYLEIKLLHYTLTTGDE
jgi:hypothetical protein